MKKLLIASIATVIAFPAFAAKVANLTSVTTGSSQTTISTGATSGGGACALLQESVVIQSSAANIGTVDCDDTTANIGVAVANISGKNKVFSAGSAGGGVEGVELTAVPTTSDTDSAAASASAGS